MMQDEIGTGIGGPEIVVSWSPENGGNRMNAAACKGIVGLALALALTGCAATSTVSGSSPSSQAPTSQGLPDVAGKLLAEATISLSEAGFYNYHYYVDGQSYPGAVGPDDLDKYLVQSTIAADGTDLAANPVIQLNLIPNPDNPPTPRPSPSAESSLAPSSAPAVIPVSPSATPTPTFTPPKPKQSVVKYVVEADGPIGLITYTNFVGNKMGQEQASDEVWGPVEKTYEFAASSFESTYGFWSLGVSAQGSGATGSITCRIFRDGNEISTQTSTGAYSMVMCNAGR
ncbi:hypothetical protein [Paenarthrobacter sp. YJN-5]|uniref:hypothetical protein n=1 Tax=Paenarthrobacter sp. YJN-5 TaxID=2735316 RepID=UPI00187851DF|nr:hypothetical protein [Paenarthrobacter sp. YJN-5]QOT19355.1 hypothetical protein HMI59_22115 [Paenarthrobacter sp. YJN-5]